MTTEVVQILERARELLGPNGERWIKYNGFETEEAPGFYCLIEALNEASGQKSITTPVNSIVRKVIGGGIIDWNDAPERTWEEVASVLERAKGLAKE